MVSFHASPSKQSDMLPLDLSSRRNRSVLNLVLVCRSEMIYSGPRKVTITVKETKTETGYPGDTELISTHVSAVQTPPAASSATRELDDLMASLSDFKVGASLHLSIYPRVSRLICDFWCVRIYLLVYKYLFEYLNKIGLL